MIAYSAALQVGNLTISSQQLSHRWLGGRCHVLEWLDCHWWFSKRSHQKDTAGVQAGPTQRSKERACGFSQRANHPSPEFLHLLLQLVSCEMLLWGKYMKRCSLTQTLSWKGEINLKSLYRELRAFFFGHHTKNPQVQAPPRSDVGHVCALSMLCSSAWNFKCIFSQHMIW